MRQSRPKFWGGATGGGEVVGIRESSRSGVTGSSQTTVARDTTANLNGEETRIGYKPVQEYLLDWDRAIHPRRRLTIRNVELINRREDDADSDDTRRQHTP